ncbi:MAG: rhomboid family intramembrane serine protease, partial [Planctomycetota bacterium]
MGFEDRDWNRSSSRGATRRPKWSVNAWIIALCAAVFVIDSFVGMTRPGRIFIDRTALDGGPFAGDASRATPAGETLTLGDASKRYGPGIVAVARRAGVAAPSVLVEPLAEGGKVVGFNWYQRAKPIEALLHFSTATALRGDTGGGAGFPQVWRFIGFQFLHANLVHLVFNMMGLWFFGPVVERYLGGKRYGAFYLLCGVCGAAMYLLLNFLGTKVMQWNPALHLPFLLPNEPTTPLVGASAGVFGVIMAAAYLAPDATVLFFFLIPMRLATLAYGLLLFAMAAVIFGWTNAGGEAAH